MRLLMTIIRFSAAPMFLLLALINGASTGVAAGPMAMMGMDMSSSAGTICGVPVPPLVTSVLGSMWLMYLLMGIFHASAWIELLSRGRSRQAGKASPRSAEAVPDVCILPDAR